MLSVGRFRHFVVRLGETDARSLGARLSDFSRCLRVRTPRCILSEARFWAVSLVGRGNSLSVAIDLSSFTYFVSVWIGFLDLVSLYLLGWAVGLKASFCQWKLMDRRGVEDFSAFIWAFPGGFRSNCVFRGGGGPSRRRPGR